MALCSPLQQLPELSIIRIQTTSVHSPTLVKNNDDQPGRTKQPSSINTHNHESVTVELANFMNGFENLE